MGNVKDQVFGYAAYMMFTSYFAKSICTNNSVEQRLLIQYKEAGPSSQIEAEDKALYLIEKELMPRIPEWVRQSRIQVKLSEREDGLDMTVYLFHSSGEWRMLVSTHGSGKNASIKMDIWKKPR